MPPATPAFRQRQLDRLDKLKGPGFVKDNNKDITQCICVFNVCTSGHGMVSAEELRRFTTTFPGFISLKPLSGQVRPQFILFKTRIQSLAVYSIVLRFRTTRVERKNVH